MRRGLLPLSMAFGICVIIVISLFESGRGLTGAFSASPPSSRQSTSALATSVDLSLEDIRFDQSKISIPSDTDVVFHLTNKGAIVHNINIDELNFHSGDIQPGASVELTLSASVGTYTYYCNIPGHEAAGMKGELTVVFAVPVPTAPSILATIQAKQQASTQIAVTTQAELAGQTATAEQELTVEAQATANYAFGIATQNADLQNALVGLATSEASAESIANAAQTEVSNGQATIAAQSTLISDLYVTQTAVAASTRVPTHSPTLTVAPTRTLVPTAVPTSILTSTPTP